MPVAPPIRCSIVKGANLAMEEVDAEQHGWASAPYSTKAQTDASAKRLLDSALRPAWSSAVRVGLATHNLFDVAWGLERRELLAPAERGRLEIEMLEGMVPAQARAVQADAGGLLLYCPIVRADELDASLAYLARRFDENTTPENFLRAMFRMRPASAAWHEQERRFRATVVERTGVSTVARRPGPDPHVARVLAGGSVRQRTGHGLHVGRGGGCGLGGDGRTVGLHRLPVRRRGGRDRCRGRPVGRGVRRVGSAVAGGAAPYRAARGRGDAGRAGPAIALMADEAGKTVREADPEVTEAVDTARYAATAALPTDAAPLGVVGVASPWNFPCAISSPAACSRRSWPATP